MSFKINGYTIPRQVVDENIADWPEPPEFIGYEQDFWKWEEKIYKSK